MTQQLFDLDRPVQACMMSQCHPLNSGFHHTGTVANNNRLVSVQISVPVAPVFVYHTSETPNY